MQTKILGTTRVNGEEVAPIEDDHPPGPLDDQASPAPVLRAGQQDLVAVVGMDGHAVHGIHGNS